MAIITAKLGDELTRRELQIHKLLVTTALEKEEIADKLFISLSTVRMHNNNIHIKLGVSSRIELMLNHYSEKVA